MKKKVTKQLFKGKYPFAIKLKLIGLHCFNSLKDINQFENYLINISTDNDAIWNAYFCNQSTDEEVKYSLLVVNYLKELTDYDIRVEIPFLTMYTCTETILNDLIQLVPKTVIQISKPPSNLILKSNEIYLPTIPFDYKVNIRGNTQDNLSFLEWAKENTNIQLTVACEFDLSRKLSHGSYFYISGGENLFLAKLYLGDQIKQILKIIH